MKTLLQLNILLSALSTLSIISFCHFTNLLATASPSFQGPGPNFEPNPGPSQDEIDFREKYRSLLDYSADLRDEVCPMCIQAAPNVGKKLLAEDKTRIKAILGPERFNTFLKVRKELVSSCASAWADERLGST